MVWQPCAHPKPSDLAFNMQSSTMTRRLVRAPGKQANPNSQATALSGKNMTPAACSAPLFGRPEGSKELALAKLPATDWCLVSFQLHEG